MSILDSEGSGPDNHATDAELIAELRRSLGSKGGKTEQGATSRSPLAAEHSADVEAVRSRPVSRIAEGLASQLLGLNESANRHLADLADGTASEREVLCLLVDGADVLVPAEGIVLGRVPGPAGVVVADVHVSRRHIRVERQDDHLVVVDLGSTNGTRILRGDEAIEVASTVVPLECRDRIVTSDGIPLTEVTLARRGREPS